MGARSSASTDSLIRNLAALYGEDAAEAVARSIERRVAACSARADSETLPRRLSARDVLLITYGDTIVDGSRRPLAVLKGFYAEHLSDVFSLLHILPFHPYSSDDGFSVIDYDSVREDLGSWSDIEDLSAGCRIMADAVINHVSAESDWFRDFLAGRPARRGFFVECDPDVDLSAVVRPRTSPLLTAFLDGNGAKRHVWTTFSADQVDLNYRNPEVLIAVIDVLLQLIERGASLLRLDAVTFLWKEPGTSCANLDQTHRLVKVMRNVVERARPGVIVITETNVPHSENVAYFGNGHDEAHMVYNFALPPLLAFSFISGNCERLRSWARHLRPPENEACFLNFSASHDGVGVRPVEGILSTSEVDQLVDAATRAGGLVSSRTLPDGSNRPYELNCTFLDLISDAADDDRTRVARFVASQALVLAMPGVPAVYIQSLLGSSNDLDRVRRTGRARSINRSQHELRSVAEMLDDPARVDCRILRAVTNLIRIRGREPAFAPHSSFTILDLGPSVFAVQRGDNLLCLINVSGKPATVTIDRAGTDIVSGEALAAGEKELAAYATVWLRYDDRVSAEESH